MKPNYAAWRIEPADWQKLPSVDKLKHLLQYAVIAPSAHNTQPWEFTITPETHKIGVYLAHSRLLPLSDAAHRQAYLSVGAAIENVCVAAEAYGGSVTVRAARKKGQHVADLTVKFGKASAVDTEALEAMVHRQSNRAPYKSERLGAETLKAIDQIHLDGISTHVVTQKSAMRKIAALGSTSTLALMDKTFKKELSEWVRHNWTEEFTGMPASVQGIPGPLSLIAQAMVANAPVERGQAKKDYKQLSEGPCLVVVGSSDDDPVHWVEAGRVFERVCLLAAHLGMTTSAYTSVIEYQPTREALQTILGTSEHPLALLRVGKPIKAMPRTPRLPVDKVIAS